MLVNGICIPKLLRLAEIFLSRAPSEDIEISNSSICETSPNNHDAEREE